MLCPTLQYLHDGTGKFDTARLIIDTAGVLDHDGLQVYHSSVPGKWQMQATS